MRATGNSFGIIEALFGIVAAFILTMIAVAAYDAAAHRQGQTGGYAQDVVGLIALWVGFLGAVVAATRTRVRRGEDEEERPRGTGSIRLDYGLELRAWPDIPLGIVVGVASQYLLVPVVEAPLAPFVHHLYHRLSHPAQTLTGHAYGAGLILLAVMVCVGSPIVEELFFRGMLLRGLLGRLGDLGPRLAPAVSIVVTALVFGLVHFEALQFLGLAGFGVVLGYLAWRTARLGPSIVAHVTFNTVTIIAIVLAR